MEQGPRVLIVDDEVVLAEGLAAQLRHRGFLADTAHNGVDALKMARVYDYDAIVCDVLMPIMDGERVYEQLRAEKPRLAEKLIFMTAYATLMASVTRRFVRSTEADLHKPFTEAQLMESLAKVIPPDRWPSPQTP